MFNKPTLADWIIFLILCFIWGSSFILMKIGLETLSAYHVASVRMASAGIVLLPFAIKTLKKLPAREMGLLLVAGLMGSFFPAYLFCHAEIHVDSALAGILNSLTPLFTIVIGIIFFHLKIQNSKIIGVLIGLIGLVLLPFAGKASLSLEYVEYASLVLIATLSYAININYVSKFLKGYSALDTAAVAFSFFIIPCVIILAATGFFQLFSGEYNAAYSTSTTYFKSVYASVAASVLLGIAGSAIATILFYRLIKTAGAVFASLVTYGSPLVAVLLGLLAGEHITVMQIACLAIILAGVYLVNKTRQRV